MPGTLPDPGGMSSLPPYSVHAAGFVQRRHPRGGTIAERAALLGDTLGDAVLVGRAAAALHGLDVLPPGVAEAAWPLQVVVAPGVRPRGLAGCDIHEAVLPEGDVCTVAGIRVTTLERTALDCARSLPRLEAVAAVDQILRAGVELDRLQRRGLEFAGQRGDAVVCSVLRVCDPAAESPGESWTRCLILDAGLPRPVGQYRLDVSGYGIVRLDLAYPDYRLAIEYDGREHHTRFSDVLRDRRRRGALESEGWTVLAVRSGSVLHQPDVLFARLLHQLHERGWSAPAGTLATIRKRINYICMCQRRNREEFRYTQQTTAIGLGRPLREE